jgi:hypothetical protein
MGVKFSPRYQRPGDHWGGLTVFNSFTNSIGAVDELNALGHAQAWLCRNGSVVSTGIEPCSIAPAASQPVVNFFLPVVSLTLTTNRRHPEQPSAAGRVKKAPPFA